MAPISAYAYELPCTIRAASYFPEKIRRGFFLRVVDEGCIGIGEYAPLSGIHASTVQQANDALALIDPREVARAFGEARGSSFSDAEDIFACFPSPMSNVLSMAYFHRAMAQRNTSSLGAVKLAALIEASDAATAIALAQSYVTQGFRHLKIKVGGLSVAGEIKKIATIAAMAGTNVRLRIDANQRFSFDDAAAFLKAVKRLPIEYCEEPTYEIGGLTKLREDYGVNIAVDESVANDGELDHLAAAQISHVIIKPGRFNNLFSTWRIVARARALGLVPIFSHCFESEFSSAIFALMIHELKLSHNAHGIVVDGMFRHGVFSEPLRSFRGHLSVDRAWSLCHSSFLSSHDALRQIMRPALIHVQPTI